MDLYASSTYLDTGLYRALADLRQVDPVHWQGTPDGGGYWAVLRHADVVHVARTPDVFSASLGGIVIDDLPPESLAMMRHMLLAMDPPVHGDHRRPLAPTFGARVIGAMEGQIRAICHAIFGRVESGVPLDFVHDVCALLPAQVVGELMGLPPADWPQLQRWAERQTSGDDAGASSMEMAMYAIEFAASRRTSARQEDLTSLILESEFGTGLMTDIDFGSFFVQLVTAGNDTTKTMLSSGTSALIDHPDQMAELRADPSVIPGAVEEILRWANPLHYFRRTAVVDTHIGEQAVAAGDKVVMMYTSANRDADVFADPDRFDIHRSPNPHLSFGIGPHFCLGAHLARLEGKVFFEELLATFPTIERAGVPVRVRSNLNNGLQSLPLTLGRGEFVPG